MDALSNDEAAARIRAASQARPFVGKPGDKVSSDPLVRNITVYEVATGKAHLVWPVDARQMCASGAFTLDPPAPEAPAAPAEEPPATTKRARKAKE